MKKTLTVMMMVIALTLSTMTMAMAGVERYQFTTYDIVVEVNGVEAYTHYYNVTHNPCTDEWTTNWAYHPAAETYKETLSAFDVTDDVLSFTAVYPNGYKWYPAFGIGTGTFVGSGPGVSLSTTNVLTLDVSQTSYNHGEYVAESVDEYGPDAKSCIGMPMVSNRK